MNTTTPPAARVRRRRPVGVEPAGDGTSHVRVWAPACLRVEVVPVDAPPAELDAEPGGYFSGFAALPPGARYRFRLDGSGDLAPDPASRFQPEGPLGPSEVVDPDAFAWTDRDWPGVRREGQVVYEMHVGTFTPEGTWAAAAGKLPHLADVGVTLLEVMPVHDFVGDFGWGYDGVCLYAPTRLYGRPDDFRRFVDRAHALGLGVILDVVYNHFGPVGNVLKRFAPAYFTDKYTTDWGEAVNYDGPDSGPVREFVAGNAAYWIDEYHLDGLRLDAVQYVYDESEEHVLAELTRRARQAAGRRSVFVVGENERQQAKMMRPASAGGYGLDALWNDDWHHSAWVALTGRAEAYYTDFAGTAREFVAAARYGFLFQGQHHRWQKRPRGTPALDVPPCAFVNFLDNHDQVANSALGLRTACLSRPAAYRAMTALLLLGPGTPMLFQGQEFACPRPFFYFADMPPELAPLVSKGRQEFLAQFPSLADAAARPAAAEPHDPATFARSKLDWAGCDRDAPAVRLHRDLIALRKTAPAFRSCVKLDAATLSEHAFALRFFGRDGDDRLLVVNLGRDFAPDILPEPLLAPPEGRRWSLVWSSEAPAYGGAGVPAVDWAGPWSVPGSSALVLAAVTEGGS